MATTTPNFGWSVPTSSDLVKNGAVAIETLGDSIDASLVDLKGGTTDQVLAKNSNTDMDFKWVTAGGGGKVLQVVEGSTSTQAGSSSSTYADSGLTATITPTSATSKILVFVGQNGIYNANTSGSNSLGLKLFRASTEIAKCSGMYIPSGTALQGTTLSLNILDSPATTSATTYKTQFASLESKATVYVQIDGVNRSSIILMEIGA